MDPMRKPLKMKNRSIPKNTESDDATKSWSMAMFCSPANTHVT
jgi:hypothetical protein